MVLKSCSFASGTSIGCNDDSCGSQSKTNPVLLHAGVPVYIAVGSYFEGSFGAGVLTVSTTDPIPTEVSIVYVAPRSSPLMDISNLTPSS